MSELLSPLAQLKEFKKTAIVSPLWMIGEVICEMIIPKLMGKIVDEGIGNKDMGYIAWKKDYIQALEVPDKFKRSGYGERLMKMAIESGARKLSVRKGNSIAIKLYEKLGFRKTKDLNPVMIEMEL